MNQNMRPPEEEERLHIEERQMTRQSMNAFHPTQYFTPNKASQERELRAESFFEEVKQEQHKKSRSRSRI